MEKQFNIIDRILNNRVLAHILFWASTLIIFPIYTKIIGIPFLAAFFIKLFFLPVQILATYYLIYYQIPKFMYQKRYVRFGISLLLSILLFSTLANLVEDLGLAQIMTGYEDEPHSLSEILSNPFANVEYNAEDVYLTVFMVTAIKFIKQQIEEKTQMTILEQEKTNTEIKLLKAQINPRILSKTLYQLHELAKNKSDRAPEVVIKLSEMLDYMLYQCNAPKVLIEKEIELIQHYLDLEKIRYGDQLKLKFFHSIDNKFSEITPLLLLSFIESFFPQTENTPANPSMEILLTEKEDLLNLKLISNLINDNSSNHNNIKKQLALLYPEQYTLTSDSKNGMQSVELNVQLIPK